MRIAVVIPVLDDWASAKRVAQELRALAELRNLDLRLLLVNDGSVDLPDPDHFAELAVAGRFGIEELDLVANLGHARAIAVGLAHVAAGTEVDAVVVMDGDGEDRVEDLPELLDAAAESATEPVVVVAERTRRSEGLAFRTGYRLYRWAFRAATGRAISYGNFCLIPWSVLRRIVFQPEIALHLASYLTGSRFRIRRVPTTRGTRYFGESKMNFVGLLQHGMAAIAVDLDRVLVRLLVALSTLAAALLGGMLTVAAIRFGTALAIPGWASNVFGLLSILLFQAVILALLLLFTSLRTRSLLGFVPALHYRDFVAPPPRTDAT